MNFVDKYLELEEKKYKIIQSIRGTEFSLNYYLQQKGLKEEWDRIMAAQDQILSSLGLDRLYTDTNQDFTAEALSWISQIVSKQDKES